MKHKIFTILFTVISFIALGQKVEGFQTETFQYSEVGLNDYVVTNVDSTTKEELYSKTLNWIKETYENPDLVLKMKIENEKVKIVAVAELLKVKNSLMNLSYELEISFKDNKYKFEIISLLYDNKTDYKNIPNFKTDKKLIKIFGTTAVDIENYFNELNESLKNYISGKTKKSEW